MNLNLEKIRKLTQARVRLTSTGHSIATIELLKMRYAQIKAKQAIYKPWDYHSLQQMLLAEKENTLIVSSCVSSRKNYLKRPDLGGKLSNESRILLANENAKQALDIVCIISDGLSAQAIDNHFLKLWQHLSIQLQELKLTIAPLILAPFSRVVISDEIGFYLKTKLAIIFIGERPGSTSIDSMGIYLTYQPMPGKKDANRNCISNIAPPNGLSYECATKKLIALINASLCQKISGTRLCLEDLP